MSSLPRQKPSQPPPHQDSDGFDKLYRDHVDLIYRYAHRLCGEAESAKDLVQETFLNAYRGLKDFRGDAQVSTWLYTIASRACMRMRRKRKGEPERELSLDDFVPTSEGEFRLQIPMDGLTPEEALQNKELRVALDHAINKLPKKYRMTLVLRDMEGLSAKEVVSNVITALTSNQMIAPSYWVDPKSGFDYMLTVQYPEGRVRNFDDVQQIPLRSPK